MGFGNGLAAPARRGVLTSAEALRTLWSIERPAGAATLWEMLARPDESARAWRMRPWWGQNSEVRADFSLPGEFEEVVFVTPPGTPSPRGLGTADERASHAARLTSVRVSPDGGSLLRDRTEIGDARDLMARVLRSRLGPRLRLRTFGAVHRIADTRLLPGAPADDPALDPSSVPRVGPRTLVVHLGRSPFVDLVLRSLPAPRDRGWDGDLGGLDGDGYAACSLVDTDWTRHLVLAGPTGYGTFFAVARFLREHLGAQWLFPGPLGEAMPAPGPVQVGAVNVFAEPAVRARSCGPGVADVGYATAVEADDVRTWLLCNGTRPTNVRAAVFDEPYAEGATFARACPLPTETAAARYAWIRATDDRVPFAQALSQFLRPLEASFVAAERCRMPGRPMPGGPMQIERPRAEVMPEVFPELRPRVVGASGAVEFGAPPRGILDPSIPPLLDGTFFLTMIPNPSVVCPDGMTRQFAPYSASAGLAESRLYAVAPVLVGRDLRVIAELPALMSSELRSPAFCEFREVTVRVGDDARQTTTFLRLIPRSYAYESGERHPSLPSTRCFFRADYRPVAGLPSPLHAGVARDIALQLHVALCGRAFRGEDPAHSIMPDDGAAWCTCDGCTRTDRGHPLGNGSFGIFYRGALIARQIAPAALSAPSLAATPGRTGGMRLGALAAARTFAWDNDARRNPFAAVTLDEASMRGVVTSPGYDAQVSVRVFTLSNGVARELVTLRGEGEPLPVLSTLGYADYTAPPMNSARAAGEDAPGGNGTSLRVPRSSWDDERLHDAVVAMLAGTRDLREYEEAQTAPAGTVAGAFGRQLEAPDQFNHERHAVAAAQTGYYEYLESQRHVVPIAYTKRLRNAVRAGVSRLGLRAWTSEWYPAWGLDGLMPCETQRILWDPDVDLGALRGTLCDAAFGDAAGEMRAYFDECEAAWSATRDGHVVVAKSGATRQLARAPDVRQRSDLVGTFNGSGIAGRGGFLSQLDGWYERSTSPRSDGRPRLAVAWALLSKALARAQGAARERVQVYRRTFGLTVLVAVWFKPLADALRLIRREVDNGLMNDPDSVEKRMMVYQGGGASRDLGYPDNIRGTRTLDQAYATVAVTLPEVALDTLRQRIGTPAEPGIRRFRNELNRYLALGNVVPDMDTMPTLLEAQGAPWNLDNLRELGMGYAPGLTALANNAPFPATRPGGPLRAVGLNLRVVELYMRYWNNLPRRPLEDLDLALRAGVREGAGLDWIMRAARETAAVVVLYTRRLPHIGADFDQLREAVLHG